VRLALVQCVAFDDCFRQALVSPVLPQLCLSSWKYRVAIQRWLGLAAVITLIRIKLGLHFPTKIGQMYLTAIQVPQLQK